ncbi:hypothetical protein [Streptomyces sp. NTH33]|uniref:hypothetical protein n=1 Tax=Streptomyces sp. NTH33 TaxID=1735453 RepID=UPI0015E8B396|nr:hypothetical protein [Streptomyces sp. NTH33]
MTMLLIGTAGCTDSHDLAVPDDVCGVTVGTDRLAPFLPSGDEVAQRSYDAGPESPRCRVSVDKKLVVHLSGDIVSTDTDPIKVQGRALTRLGDPAPADNIGDDARIADNGAMAVARCTYQGEQRKFVALVQLQKEIPKERPERRDALEDFLRAYFPKAMEKLGCQGS